MNARIYLDHNATAPLHPAAAAVLRAHAQPGLAENPSAIHAAGQAARRELSRARDRLAVLLAAAPVELVFTASGSEANALAVHGAVGLALATAPRTRRRLLASAVEHASVLKILEACARLYPGIQVEQLPVDAQGRLDLARAERALGPDVALVSLMLANNETGVLQPVAALSLLARTHGVLVHCDAAQALAKVPVALSELPVDLLTAGAHKFGGGLGCGLLFVRKGLELPALLPGHQELGRRGGTENVAAISAAAAALEAQLDALPESQRRVEALRDRFEAELLKRVEGLHVNGPPAPRLPGTSNLLFEGADGQALVIALDLAGISASTGAACASGTLEPSHVLLAMGLPPERAAASVRFSLGSTTTDAEIDRVLEVLPPLVEQVRRYASPRRRSSPA